MYFLILNNFFKNGSPGQTTMLMRRASKFCVEPRSPFSEIFHHDPKTLGKPLIIVSWPECRLGFPRDDDGGGGGGDDGGFPRTLESGRSPGPTCPGTKYPVRGIPHFDMCLSSETYVLCGPYQSSFTDIYHLANIERLGNTPLF